MKLLIVGILAFYSTYSFSQASNTKIANNGKPFIPGVIDEMPSNISPLDKLHTQDHYRAYFGSVLKTFLS